MLMWGILAGARTHQGGFARFEAQIRWGLVLFGCSVTRSGCAPTCGWLEACLPFRARIDDGACFWAKAREILCRMTLTRRAAFLEIRMHCQSRLVYFAGLLVAVGSKIFVWFFVGARFTQWAVRGAPESPTS